MRKLFLCSLLALGFINFSYGQKFAKSERLSVMTFDENGEMEKFRLRGKEAVAFDVASFIKENDHLQRIIINGSFRSALNTTLIRFDSHDQKIEETGNVCKEVKSTLTPFLGVWGTGTQNHNGVDIKEIIAHTSAERAGILASENIIAFDEVQINNFRDLKDAVLASNVGDHVELTLQQGSQIYTKPVIVGSRGTETITYNYCEEEPEQVQVRDMNVNSKEISLTAFPNPTNLISHVSFESSSNEDVLFSVTDLAGTLVHKEVYKNTNGRISFEYSFDNVVSGTYILTMRQGTESSSRKVLLIKE